MSVSVLMDSRPAEEATLALLHCSPPGSVFHLYDWSPHLGDVMGEP